jgi:hypothetical protein
MDAIKALEEAVDSQPTRLRLITMTCKKGELDIATSQLVQTFSLERLALHRMTQQPPDEGAEKEIEAELESLFRIVDRNQGDFHEACASVLERRFKSPSHCENVARGRGGWLPDLIQGLPGPKS